MPAGVEFPPEARAKFLAALALTGKVSGPGGAAEACGVAVPTLYAWKNRDEQFFTDWEAALTMRDDLLAAKGLGFLETVVDDLKADTKDRITAAKVLVDRQAKREQKLLIEASGEIKFVIESAFPEVIAAEYVEDDDDNTDRPALPGEPETA